MRTKSTSNAAEVCAQQTCREVEERKSDDDEPIFPRARDLVPRTAMPRLLPRHLDDSIRSESDCLFLRFWNKSRRLTRESVSSSPERYRTFATAAYG